MINYKSRTYGKTKEISIAQLKALFEHQKLAYLDVILLFGSRAKGTATRQSDYDFVMDIVAMHRLVYKQKLGWIYLC